MKRTDLQAPIALATVVAILAFLLACGSDPTSLPAPTTPPPLPEATKALPSTPQTPPTTVPTVAAPTHTPGPASTTPPAPTTPVETAPPTAIPTAAVPATATPQSVSESPGTQVIPPMESLSSFTVDCLKETLPSLKGGKMYTPLLKAMVDCLTPQELAATRRYIPPGGGPAQDLEFECNEAWFNSIRAMFEYFGEDIPTGPAIPGAAASPIVFEERAARAGVVFRHTRDSAAINLGGGVAAGDFNGDGHLDLYATNSAGPNALFRNNGDGTFTEVAAAAGVDDPEATGYGAGWADYDNDGDLDLYVANFGASKLFRNDGDGSFTDVTAGSGVADPDADHRTMGVAWGDYDGDGFLDLLIVRHLMEIGGKLALDTPGLARASRPMALFHNNGDGTFSNATALLSDDLEYPSPVKGAGFKPAFLDFDNDGDADIYVVNDFGAANYPNVLWRNDGKDSSGQVVFTDVSKESGTDLEIFGMGLAVGDYDNDGDFDLYMTDIGEGEFLENQGDGTFVNETESTGTAGGTIPENWFDSMAVSWGTVFADLDNDGLLDLYSVAGQMDNDPCFNMTNQPNSLFANMGDGTFSDVSAASGANDPGTGRGVAHGDFNGDGRLDLFVVNMGTRDGEPGISRLLINLSDNDNSWLAISPSGTDGNRFGIGAKIAVTAGGVTQIREMGASQSHMSNSVVPVHFGLGDSETVDTVEIFWPSGKVLRLENVAVNQKLEVVEPAQ